MIGIPLALLAGAALGWLSGHMALVVPAGGWGVAAFTPARLRARREPEHLLGAVLGTVGLALAYVYRDSWPDLLVTSLFLLLLISILIIDLRHHLVYPAMPLLGFVTALPLNPIGGEASFPSALYGGVAGAAAFFLLFLLGLLLFRVQALGFGDVLLALMIGAMVGLPLTPAALLLGTVLGALGSLALLAFRRKGLGDYIPFGSGMCLAAMVVIVLRG